MTARHRATTRLDSGSDRAARDNLVGRPEKPQRNDSKLSGDARGRFKFANGESMGTTFPSGVRLNRALCYASGRRAMTLTRASRICVVVAVCAAVWVRPSSGQAPRPGSGQADGLEVLQVRPNFFMIAGAGGNIGVQVGDDGVVVVDAGSAASAAAVVAAIKRITPKPIRYIIDTGPDADHVGGNDVLSKAGDQFFPGTRPAGARPDALRSAASIVAAEGVAQHLTAGADSTRAPVGLPTESFHYARKYLYLNDEAIEVLHQPEAHTDSDVFVFFRRSDVVVAGDVIDARRFPVIDLERGGSIEGEIAALNRLADLAVPSVPVVSREAGTIVIPGHGRLYDQFDVIEYRDMITIIRDRIRKLVDAGRSLEQVKAAAPAKGYAGRYGNDRGDWTTDKFVEAVYRSLMKEKS
jgi:glyoxylase-like metal-dependent hydrolase (beta-lactamase superfamily II)